MQGIGPKARSGVLKAEVDEKHMLRSWEVGGCANSPRGCQDAPDFLLLPACWSKPEPGDSVPDGQE